MEEKEGENGSYHGGLNPRRMVMREGTEVRSLIKFSVERCLPTYGL
jgi:hypothetical protein